MTDRATEGMTIAQLAELLPGTEWHIVDATTYGLFDHPRRQVDVVSSHGDREVLGQLIQRNDHPYYDAMLGRQLPSTVIDHPVFVPNVNLPWGRVNPVVDWMREHHIEVNPLA